MKSKILISWPLDTSRFQKYQDEFIIEALNSHEDRYGQVTQKIGDYDGLLAIGLNVDAQLLRKSQNLRVIGNFGVGYDNIDTASAKVCGVAVANTPKSTTNPTANHTMALILSLLRKISEHDRKLKNGTLKIWNGRKVLGTSIEGKTLGIIGMGRIGKAVAQRALAFNMNISYHQRNRLPRAEESTFVAKYLTLVELLSSSDIISIHTPLTNETRDMVGSKELKLIKPSAFIINTARGGIINENALIKALTSKSIAGAGIDVFENEPNPKMDFFELENVVITPHNGTGTHEARNAMMEEAMDNIVSFLRGIPMSSRVA